MGVDCIEQSKYVFMYSINDALFYVYYLPKEMKKIRPLIKTIHIDEIEETLFYTTKKKEVNEVMKVLCLW